MKKRPSQNLNFPDFFEKFSFQTLARDFSNKQNDMFYENHAYYRSPIKAEAHKLPEMRIACLVNHVFNGLEDANLFEKLMP